MVTIGTLKQTTIGPPAKRHLNGISLVGRWWAEIACWQGYDLEVKVHLSNQRVWIVMPTPLAYFDGGYSYLTQCLPEMCR